MMRQEPFLKVFYVVQKLSQEAKEREDEEARNKRNTAQRKLIDSMSTRRR